MGKALSTLLRRRWRLTLGRLTERKQRAAGLTPPCSNHSIASYPSKTERGQSKHAKKITEEGCFRSFEKPQSMLFLSRVCTSHSCSFVDKGVPHISPCVPIGNMWTKSIRVPVGPRDKSQKLSKRSTCLRNRRAGATQTWQAQALRLSVGHFSCEAKRSAQRASLLLRVLDAKNTRVPRYPVRNSMAYREPVSRLSSLDPR